MRWSITLCLCSTPACDGDPTRQGQHVKFNALLSLVKPFRRSLSSVRRMEAATLNCPMCGASASTEATRCQHCGARLATVSCPSCFGLMFLGAKFCSHCGAKAESVAAPVTTPLLCPRCRVRMEATTLGQTDLRVCPRCDGVWVD